MRDVNAMFPWRHTVHSRLRLCGHRVVSVLCLTVLFVPCAPEHQAMTGSVVATASSDGCRYADLASSAVRGACVAASVSPWL